MGKGGHNTLVESSHDEQIDSTLPHRLPTLSEIKVKIPAHCFRPTVRESMTYVAKDIVYVALTFFVMYQIQKMFTYGFMFFPVYWYIQGTLYTSLFVLGHDCGHGSFSFYPLLNNIVGTILHTWILAPYYTWKVTHNKHHKNTCNIDKDEVFYPQQGEAHEDSLMDDIFFWFPGVGWFYYLIKGYSPRTVNHFNPFEPMFYNKHFFGVCSSLALYLGMCYLMFVYAMTYGFINLLAYHIIPVFIFASYMVIITLLHHTEIDVPWYTDSEWNNVKGQLSTVDRHYGHAHSIIHSIGTHQIHHLFTKVPHYHLEEATAHFRKAFPDLVRYNEEPVLFAFARMCKIFLKQRSFQGDSKGDRMWNFAIGIYFISLNPTNLQGVAINGIALNVVVILFATAIGNWIDRNPRLSSLRKILFFQNLSVASMAVLVVYALYNQSTIPSNWMIIIQGFLIGIGMIAQLSSVACKVSVSRDWIVALYGSDRQNLASRFSFILILFCFFKLFPIRIDTNATLRRIDLLSGVLAPILTGAVMAFTSRWISAVLIAGWNVVSLGFELFLYTRVYHSAIDVLSHKTSSEKSSESKKKEGISKFCPSFQGLGTYASLSVCLPGLSLALLYMTVLSFDSVTRAYVIEQGLSEVLLGLLNGLGSIVGIIGTFIYPIFVKRTGLVRTGVIGFWSEFSMLILCLLSLFVHGTSFTPFKRFTIGSCHLYEMSNKDSTINIKPFECSNSKFSVLLLVIGITLNRFGLWIADLTVTQLQQERVPENIRGRIGGTQHSLNQFFDMLRYTLIILLPRMSQFGYHICSSVLSVFLASFIYTIWSCSSASQLVPPATDIEMSETNANSVQQREADQIEMINPVDNNSDNKNDS
ncbi:unnamed protein product [Adineta steineri]|uniref:Fatty acid desaturase domain-containing protein n=1 Tax=Adineta steineri TaxID=433720 RepID=A0A814IPN2_9BILA|nr:unnamed protein product [Adineta steineri]